MVEGGRGVLPVLGKHGGCLLVVAMDEQDVQAEENTVDWAENFAKDHISIDGACILERRNDHGRHRRKGATALAGETRSPVM
jgi:hypothetical protein